jgi:hypothetical protein
MAKLYQMMTGAVNKKSELPLPDEPKLQPPNPDTGSTRSGGGWQDEMAETRDYLVETQNFASLQVKNDTQQKNCLRAV